MLYVSRRRALGSLGRHAILSVDPRRIDREIGQHYRLYQHMLPLIQRGQSMGGLGAFAAGTLQKVTYAYESFFLTSAQLADCGQIESAPYYQLAEDFARHRERPRDSQWFAQLSEALRDTGTARHKGIEMKSEAEIMVFLTGYVGGMFDSLEREGYIEGRAADIGTAVIGPDGEIIKAAAGRHRFAISRLLGVAPIPMLIMGADAGWARSVGADRGGEALVAAVQKVARRHLA